MKYVAVILLLLPGIVAAVNLSTTVVDAGVLNIQMAKYDPTPAEAGNVVTVWIKAENRGIVAVNNATFIFLPGYPFSLPNSDPQREYGSITGLDDIKLEYKLLVNEKALNGTYTFKIKYAPDGRIFSEKEFSITVREKAKKEKADLEAILVSLEPPAYSLSETNLTVEIANRDKATAYFTIVKADTDVASIERKGIFVGNLQADDSDSVTFELEIKNVTGQYPVKLAMLYKDENSNAIEENGTVYINVVRKPFTPAETPLWIYAIYIASAAIVLKLAVIPLLRRLMKFLPGKKR